MLRLFLSKLAAVTAFVLLFTAVPASAQEGPSRERSSSVVTIEGRSYYVHAVLSGDTFYSLGRLYGVSEDEIKAANPILVDGLKAGQVVKVPVRTEPQRPLNQRQMNRLFDRHVVNRGETAYSISQRYGISLAALQEDNEGFDPAHIAVGQIINIRKNSQDKTDAQEIAAEIESYSEALNSVVDDGYERYVVKRGDTFYSLGREKGVSEAEVKALNPEVARDGLKYGAIIRLPKAEAVPPAVAGGLPGGEAAGAAGDRSRGGFTDVPGFGFGFGFGETAARGFKNIDVTRPLNVAIMLPLRGTGINDAAARNFLDFYRGCLVALEELKAMGTSVNVDLFNTAHSAEEVRGILAESGGLQGADIIIGPVYDDAFREVADFAARRGIIAVSPLAAVGEYPNVFQMAPTNSTKMEKFREDLTPENNVIVISSSADDQAFMGEITPLLPSSAHRVTHSANSHTEIRSLLSTDRENVFVVFSSNPVTVEQILAGIASVHSDIVARNVRHPSIRVIGPSSWVMSPAFNNVDRALYFKTQVRVVASYHADRGDARVVEFDRKYIDAYTAVPTYYSYRGYDVAKLFVGTVRMHGADFVSYLNGGGVQLLETPYYFQQAGYGGKYENRTWPKVCYNKDYTIGVR